MKTSEKLGIVYTPVEVVDFILNSVNDVLQKNFGKNLSDKNVHILDPFTGTGTFLVRLIENFPISAEKFQNELHANEIVLLAYYIAAINIENAFNSRLTDQQIDRSIENNSPKTNDLSIYPLSIYRPFTGICFADTFLMTDEKKFLSKNFLSIL